MLRIAVHEDIGPWELCIYFCTLPKIMVVVIESGMTINSFIFVYCLGLQIYVHVGEGLRFVCKSLQRS